MVDLVTPANEEKQQVTSTWRYSQSTKSAVLSYEITGRCPTRGRSGGGIFHEPKYKAHDFLIRFLFGLIKITIDNNDAGDKYLSFNLTGDNSKLWYKKETAESLDILRIPQ